MYNENCWLTSSCLEDNISSSEWVESCLLGHYDAQLFSVAKRIRKINYSNFVYIRAIIDISNYCTCNCSFCGNAGGNNLNRYRMSQEEIIECIKTAQHDGIDIIHLASGCDPHITADYIKPILAYCAQNKISVELAVGLKEEEFYHEIKKEGCHRVILKFETSSEHLFAITKLCGKELDEYIKLLLWLHKEGFQVGTGNIVGLPGQSVSDIVSDIHLINKLQPSMISTSVFIPNEISKMSEAMPGDKNMGLRMLALISILNRDRFVSIPTNSTFGEINKVIALDIAANLLSVNYTPSKYKYDYSIYSGGNRHRASIFETEQYISNAGMERVSYKEFINGYY